MKIALALLFGALACLAGANALAGASLNDQSELQIKEFMGHVMQRNAEQIWQWTAEETDLQGERSGKPVTDEDWENAESDALTLQQLSYGLEHSAYGIPDVEWDRHLASFRAAASASAEAAERKDYPALQKAGDRINEQCVACHLTFKPEIEAPPPPLPDGF
ncbi:cytochrome c [Sphingobium bisphenolivorans]|uniref:cytochrome c n=1 Tax=Sphingobium bisphenolivorans TaxID=1335760 RepID=UPI0003A2CC6D|nr:cytochrome c [Sphingobium bisphenolivorans]